MTFRQVYLVSSGLMLCLGAALAPAESFDVIIRGGTVFDGTGQPRYEADIGVRKGHIARIGDLSKDIGAVDFDASGLFVAPGFINTHSHPTAEAVGRAENMLTQGVTTEIANPDGYGEVDLPAQALEFQANGLAVNLGFFIGFNAVWKEVIGETDVRATPEQIERMRALTSRGFESGAWGLSAGLDYKPGYYADLDEVIAVASAARPWRTIFQNHERLKPEMHFSSLTGIRETLTIGNSAGLIPVITHVKVQGVEQHRSQEVLDMMEGTYTAADIYPYTAGQNDVRKLFMPAWALEGGEDALFERFENPALRKRIIADIEQVLELRFNGPAGVYVGAPVNRELRDLMTERSVSAGEAIIQLNIERRGALPRTVLRFGSEQAMLQLMRQPATAIACDCGAAQASDHPRYFGAFPRVLGRYVRDQAILTWEDAIRKMTGLPASTIGLVDRGFVAVGMAADVTVFDPARISDKADFGNPNLLSEGVRLVLVNGKLALNDSKITGEQGGVILRRTRHMPSRAMSIRRARLVGTAILSGYKVSVDVTAGSAGAAVGTVTVTDHAGAQVFVADRLGLLQSQGSWTALTGQGTKNSFSLLVDDGRVILAVEGMSTLTGSGSMKISARH